MSRRMVSFVLGAALLVMLAGCGRGVVRAAGEKMQEAGAAVESMAQTPSHRISREQAQSIALEHAGLTADQVTGLHIEYESDRGWLEYNVEFRQGAREYDYEIDAETGEILSYSVGD